MTGPCMRTADEAARYLAILNSHVDLVCRCSPTFTLTFVNDAFCESFRHPRHALLGTDFRELIAVDAREAFFAPFADLDGTPMVQHDYACNTPDGVSCWQQWRHRAITNDNGTLREYQSVGREITRRKLMEAQLREREARYRAIVANAAMGICLIDQFGQFLECNPAFVQMIGHDPETLALQTLAQVTHPADAAREQERLADLWHGAETGYTLEKRLITQDGDALWVLAMTTLIRDADDVPQYAVQVLENISARKDAERIRGEYQEKLRAATLNATLAEERERRHIAQNLHDHIGQSLAISRLLLGRLAASLTDADPEQQAQIDEVRMMLGEMLDYSRTLTCELSPPVLHELGLIPAVKWLATHCTERYRLPTAVDAALGVPALAPEIRVILYHIIRELLINVVKHAHATRATVRLHGDAQSVTLTVDDDGCGMDDVRKAANSHGFGLFSVRERVGQLGGTFEIISAPHAGTCCRLSVPLHNLIGNIACDA